MIKYLYSFGFGVFVGKSNGSYSVYYDVLNAANPTTLLQLKAKNKSI